MSERFQKAVVDFRTGYAVAMAAPGSGKTVVIVQRILALLREGVAPQDILSLTFTKEGAKRMNKYISNDGMHIAVIKRNLECLRHKARSIK